MIEEKIHKSSFLLVVEHLIAHRKHCAYFGGMKISLALGVASVGISCGKATEESRVSMAAQELIGRPAIMSLSSWEMNARGVINT